MTHRHLSEALLEPLRQTWRVLRRGPSQESPSQTFEQYAEGVSLQHTFILVLLTAATVVLFWPTDFFAAAPDQRLAFGAYRLGMVVVCAATYLGLAVSSKMRENPNMVAMVFIAVVVAAAMYPMRENIGLEKRYVDAIAYLPLATIALMLDPVRRIMATVTVTAGWLLLYAMAHGYGFTDTQFLAHAVNMTAGGAISVIMGHAAFVLLRGTYTARRRLATFNQDLEREVQHKTLALRESHAREVALRDDERRRIAREIHDETGQLLQGLRFEVDLLEIEHPPSDPARYVRLNGLLDGVLTSLRRILVNLNPAPLVELGLEKAIERLIEQTREQFGLRIEASLCACPAGIAPEVELALYRAAQESLTNVVKHAKAGRIDVSLRTFDDEGKPSIELQVVDDGVGLSNGSAPPLESPHAFGLRGMRERSHDLGGHFDFRASPGGTCVCVRLPQASVASERP